MTIRNQLAKHELDETTHAGLWLDRYLPQLAQESDAPKDAVRAHINKLLARAKVPAVYRSHYQRWTALLADLGTQNAARTAEATVDGRMIVGLGAESVLEVGISLHRTYGVPLIPGSALKGLAARHARRLANPEWNPPKRASAGSPNMSEYPRDPSEGQSYRALFGDHEEAGCVVFHDALWVPPPDTKDKEKTRLPLDLDVMTVHHAAYYSAKDDTPPADSDDPNPVPFVTAQGTYLIALEGPPAWTDAAMTLLKMALRSEGIGAKTAAGYGRLSLDYTSATMLEKEQKERAKLAAAEADKQAKAAEADRLRRIEEKRAQLKVNTAGTVIPELLALAGDDVHSIAQKCEEKLGRKAIRDAMKDGKKWVKPLAAILYPDDKGASS